MLSRAESQGGALPRVPQQAQGWALLQKAAERSVPTEQMEKLRFLLGRVPAPPESYLRQFLGQWTASPRQALSCPRQVWSCFIGSLVCRASWEGMWGGTGLLVVASVFPANMACAKVSYPTRAVGLPRRCPGCQPLQDPGLGSCGALNGTGSLEGGLLPVGSSQHSSQARPGPGRRECSRSGDGCSNLSGPCLQTGPET